MKKEFAVALIATVLAASAAFAAERPPVPAKGTEGPDIRVTQPVKGIESPDVR